MKDLTQFLLPFPYAGFEKYDRNRCGDFNTYKEQVMQWVDDSTVSWFDHDYVSLFREYLPGKRFNFNVVNWFENHKDKVKMLNDFSGVAFGVKIDQAVETITIVTPKVEPGSDDEALYPNFNIAEFMSLSLESKLDWLYENCEFIPIRIIMENVLDGNSHKYGHIKRDEKAMKLLENFLSSMGHNPNDETYYYILKNNKRGILTLVRDKVLSPKTSSDTAKESDAGSGAGDETSQAKEE